VDLDEIEPIGAHAGGQLGVLTSPGSGHADVADSSLLLPLLHLRNELGGASEVMTQQHVNAPGPQPLERARKDVRARGATTGELGREEHAIACAEALERLANEPLTVAVVV